MVEPLGYFFWNVEITSGGDHLTSPTNWWYNGGRMGLYTFIPWFFLVKWTSPTKSTEIPTLFQLPSAASVYNTGVGETAPSNPRIQGFHSMQKDRMYNVRLIIHEWHMFFPRVFPKFPIKYQEAPTESPCFFLQSICGQPDMIDSFKEWF